VVLGLSDTRFLTSGAFTRLAKGFSRKIENLEAAVNLHMAYFNFCWRPGSMKVTPAQAAGIADHCWTFDELLAC
jgi:hypothetical protein